MYCSIVLTVDIQSTIRYHNVDVTSNHLEISPIFGVDVGEAGEELGKRVEGFGLPVGKSE